MRFSDASSLPALHDAAEVANPHGMSIKFHLPNGAESDIVANSLKFFTVATGEEFRDLQLAAATNPPGGPKSAQFEAFLKKSSKRGESERNARHPGQLRSRGV